MFSNINNVGIFNPRLNIAYRMSMSDIKAKIIKEIEEKVIGYEGE